MKPSFPSPSPFAYQTPLSSRSHRSGDTQTQKSSREGRGTSERLSKKHSRSSDEGRSTSRDSRSHSSSASSLFSQQNVTLEDIPALAPPSTPISPIMSASKPTLTSRPVKSTPRPSSQSLLRAAGQQGPSKKLNVEDDFDVTPTPTPLKTPLQSPIDSVKPDARPPPPTASAEPASATAPAPTQHQVPPKVTMVPAALKAGEISEDPHLPLPSGRREPPAEAKPQTRRSLDETISRQSSIPSPNPVAHSVASAASPPHSPRLHGFNPYSYQPGYMAAPPFSDSQRSSPAPAPPPPQGIPSMSYGYMPMMTGGPPNSMYGNPYYGMPFSPPAEPMMQNSERPRSPPSTQDEHQQLLEKVAGVLPDINRLLHNYKETHGQLSTKELLAKQADLSHNEQLSKVKVELDATKKEYEKVIHNLVGERSKLERELIGVRQRLTNLEKVEADCVALRSEVEALQANRKELTEGFDVIRRSKEEMQTLKLVKEKENETLKKALQAEKELHHRNLADVKEQAQDQMDLKQKEFHKTIGDHKLNYSKAQTELTSLVSKHNIQKKDLEVARSSDADHKVKLDVKNKEIEGLLARHSQEIGSIKQKHGEEQERLAQEGEARVTKIRVDYSSKEKAWEQRLHDIGAELESEKAKSQGLQEKLKTLESSKEAEKLQKSAELVETLALWRTKSKELQQQNQNLDRLLQGLGYATEIKSKGDGFFLEAFNQLAEQIVNVSRDCFTDLPDEMPRERLLLIPREIPIFMDSTPVATELRACYVQHVISSILLTRIFEPFLFTLGRRYGGVDTFLQSLSTNIRQKSERRAAVWKQTTLRAAYTVSKAKEAINIVAAVIVDEIMDEIKDFAHHSYWPAIMVGVQRIVKSAAEVWRFARVEREVISSYMPDVGAFDAPECDWPEPRFEGSFEAVAMQGHDISNTRQVILCLLPHVVREPVHEGFLEQTDKLANNPCVYLQGRALYADSTLVLAREKELETPSDVDPHS